MEQELIAANNRLLEKRRQLNQTDSRTPSITKPEPVDFLEAAERAKVKWAENMQSNVISLEDPRRPEPRQRVSLFWCGVSSKYEKCGFDNFEGNDRLVTLCKKLSGEKKDIVLHGPTGCGKTHLATAILKEYIENDHEALFITAPELLLKIRSAFNPNPELSEQELIDRHSGCGLLVLDDLGAEKSTEYSITTLYLIIDRRIRYERQTVITTNLSLEEIEKTLGARIASRLSGMENINIKMPDYRKKR